MAFISFGKLQLGAYFKARGRKWIKSPLWEENGKMVNAYCPDFDNTKPEPTIKVDYFDEAMLVQPDSNKTIAKWADVPNKKKGGS